MLIALAGLPATGKSTLAQQLAAALRGVVLDKDQIRAALFPAGEIEYSTTQDDFCVDIMYQVAAYMFRRDPKKHVIIDGRTFLKQYQVIDLIDAARRMGVPLKIIECVCSDATAQQRLQQDRTSQRHHAQNRTFELYLRLKAAAEPITLPRLVINTDSDDVVAYAARALAYVQQDT